MNVAGGLCAGCMLTEAEEGSETARPAKAVSLQGVLGMGCVAALSSIVVLAMSGFF
jgi:hypothetical protein